MNRKSIALSAIIGVVSVWFSSHAGAGFATGRQEVSYFVSYGFHAIWIGFFAMLITGASIFIGLEMARIYQVYDYKNWLKILFAPYSTVPALLWEIFYLYGAIIATGAAIAGGADLVRQALHIPYGIGVIMVGSLLLLLTIFGSGLVRHFSTGMAIFMIIAIITVAVLGIKLGSANLTNIVDEKTTTAGFGKIVWMAFLYGAFQSILVAPVISVAEPLKTRKNNIIAAVLGTVVNGMMLTFICIMLLGFFPSIAKENLPVYYVTCLLKFTWLKILYSFLLFFALVSTGVGLIYGIVKRFEVAWSKGSGIFRNLHARRITICILSMLIAALISLAGLTRIVNVGYYTLGIISIFLNIIPLFLIAPFRLIKKGVKPK